ncbi:MAG: NAD-dependent epimerase/dehydratase family protein, partial [Nanoarchaeota archaeon]
YLVTGGSGFCGVEIVKFLLHKKEKVRVLDIEPLPEELRGKVEFIQADIRDKKKVDEACKNIDRIIHTVAKVPISKAGKEFWGVNVEGTRNVLEAALKNKVKKVVHISTSAVQFLPSPVDEYAPYKPIGDYAKSKLDGELVCREYIKKGLDVDIIRPRTVLGTGRLGIFDIFFGWISKGKNIYILGNGKNKIQFLHSEDLASCCYLSSLKKGSNIFNIGSKDFSSLREDLQWLLNYADTGSKIISMPTNFSIMILKLLDVLHLSPLASWHYLTFHKDFYFTNERAKKVLGWKPRYGNREIFKISYDSYLKNKSRMNKYGTSHRKPLKQGILKLLKLLP